MSDRAEHPSAATARLLREWPLPQPEGDKHSRGNVLVVGGSTAAPGAVILGGISALRAGAGRLTLAVPAEIAVPIGVAVPESATVALPERHGTDDAALRDELATADAVLFGPGWMDPVEAKRILLMLLPVLPPSTPVALDAFALGVLPELPAVRDALAHRVVLSPNGDELRILVGHDRTSLDRDVVEAARLHRGVVTCSDTIANASGATWKVDGGGPELGTSGSGDVLAGMIVGLLARGAEPAQAAVWATAIHTTAGRRTLLRCGSIGFTARDLSAAIPSTLGALENGRESPWPSEAE